MPLKDQPYLPLYIQDVLTDEKLVFCSMQSHGLYLRLLCILHKQEKYGMICLKQRHKQSVSKYKNFALCLVRQTPWEQNQIESALIELEAEGVITITDDELYQKRMVRDGELSLVRAKAGKKGGAKLTKQYGKKGFLYWIGDYSNHNKIGISVNPQNRLYRLRSDLKKRGLVVHDKIEVTDMGKAEDFAHALLGSDMDGEWVKLNHDEVRGKFDLIKAKLKAKFQANTENEYEYENEYENDIEKRGGAGGESEIDEVIEYLNTATGKSYKQSTKKTRSLIRTLLKDYSIQEIKDVIDLKVHEWISDSKMSQYLRPETLFNATKFEGYHQSVQSIKNGTTKIKSSKQEGIRRLIDSL